MASGFVDPIGVLSVASDRDEPIRNDSAKLGSKKKLSTKEEEALSETSFSNYNSNRLGGVDEKKCRIDVVDVIRTSGEKKLVDCSSTKEWGMGYRCARFREFDGSRRRGTDEKFNLRHPWTPSNFVFSKNIFAYETPIRTAIVSKIDYRRRRSAPGFGTKTTKKSNFDESISAGSDFRSRTSSSTRLFSALVCIFIVLAEFSSLGNAFSSSSSCVAEQCAVEFMRALDHDKVLLGSNLPYCTLLSNYGACLNRTSRSCRGNLKFHSLNTMVMTKIRDHNCTALIEYRRKLGSAKMPLNGRASKSRLNATTIESIEDNQGGGGRCLFPYQHQKGAGGYRYCSMFGDPHLRTFEGQYETCRTLGAWPLMDNSYFGVQVTNDPVADGFDASGISKVTVIVKSLAGCTDQKMFEATKDVLPSTFVDGTTNSGEPNTNSISGSSYHYLGSALDNDRGVVDGAGADNQNRPAVLIRTTEIDRHIEIHLRYISTRVVIRRVGNYLTVAIKIPEEVISQRSSLNTLQLCLTGCPSTERINYKEVLAYPEYYVKKWGAPGPALSRDRAVDDCRRVGVTDFFFDSCVFDLLMTGDDSFKESAAAAMNDIRQMYPPYRKHYETNRSNLDLYDELAKLGRDLEKEEREQHGHKRRQPSVEQWNSNRQQNDDQRSAAGSRNSRTRNSAPKTSVTFWLLFCLTIIAVFLRRSGDV